MYILIHICVHLDTLNINLKALYSKLIIIIYVWGYNIGDTLGIQYSLVNLVWDTASTGSYGGTVFLGGVCYSLVNNVCGIRYSLGYKIHSDTVMYFLL